MIRKLVLSLHQDLQPENADKNGTERVVIKLHRTLTSSKRILFLPLWQDPCLALRLQNATPLEIKTQKEKIGQVTDLNAVSSLLLNFLGDAAVDVAQMAGERKRSSLGGGVFVGVSGGHNTPAKYSD